MAADWQDEVYRNTPLVRFVTTTGEEQSAPLLDFDLLVDYGATETDAIVVEVRGEEISTRLRCSLTPFPAVHYLDETQPRWQIERGFRRIDFVLYLTDNPLRFHFADGSLLEGCQLFQAPDDDNTPYDANLLMQPVAWDSEQVDIQREFGACRPPLCSIQEWLSARLVASDALVVFYDHRKGECADYLTLALDADGQPVVSLYHCKGAGGATSGDRVDDLYEVCGQATKCMQWRNKKRLIARVKHRFHTGSPFHKGDMKTFLDLLEPYPRFELSIEIYAVQPGVSKSRLSPKIALLLSTTSRGLVSFGCKRLQVMCSH